MSKLSENIKYYRINAGMKQSDLAKKIGKAPSVIANWEAETNRPDVNSIELLCKIFEVDANTLFEWETPPSFPPALTPSGQRIGRLYDRADRHDKDVVDVVLNKYDIPDTKKAEDNSPAGADILHIEDIPKRTIPLYDEPASAGTGLYLDGDGFIMIEVDDDVPRNADFGIRISGDSMEPYYMNGFIAWVKKTEEVNIGETGIFSVDGDSFIKELGKGELISQNPKYDPLILTEDNYIKTYGKVIGSSPDIWQ